MAAGYSVRRLVLASRPSSGTGRPRMKLYMLPLRATRTVPMASLGGDDDTRLSSIAHRSCDAYRPLLRSVLVWPRAQPPQRPALALCFNPGPLGSTKYRRFRIPHQREPGLPSRPTCILQSSRSPQTTSTRQYYGSTLSWANGLHQITSITSHHRPSQA